MEEEKFSDDPTENMKIENEILKLKMKAQFGEAFMMSSEDLPPEIENQFLKNVLSFEQKQANAKMTTVRSLLGNPDFAAAEALTDDEIELALQGADELLQKKGLFLDRINAYPARLIYTFMTTEFLDFEVEDNLLDGNMGYHFMYEEFYPNNEEDIMSNTKAFMEHWEEKNFGEYSNELDWKLLSPITEREYSRQEFYDEKLNFFMDAYVRFEDFEYVIDRTHYEAHGEGVFMGHSEGQVKYNAVMENGELIAYDGPFKLYQRREENYWSIFYFVMPGLDW